MEVAGRLSFKTRFPPPPFSPLKPPTRPVAAFTLVEICVSILIVLLIIGIAIPSLTGVFAERRLRASYDEFTALTATAQRRSVSEKKTYLLTWDRDGAVRLMPEGLSAKLRREVPAASLPAGARYELRFADAIANPGTPREWAFFPTGNCEPVTVRCEAPAGTWEASFNALTARGAFRNFAPK